MKRFKISKIKNWRKAEIEELRTLIDSLSNEELCARFNVPPSALANTLQKYNISRSSESLKEMRSGQNNPQWKGGISKDGARYSAIQRERYPERKHARDAVYRALKEGRMVKPQTCQDCGKEAYLEGHHSSYEESHWLDVQWCCKSCHNKRDKALWQDSTQTINTPPEN